MADRQERVEELFLRLRGLDAAGAEAALLELSGGDPELAADVRALLDADRVPEPVRDAAAEEAAPPGLPPDGAGGWASGRYEFVGEIGRGGMGIVHKVYDRVLGRHVALKVLREPEDEREEARAAGADVLTEAEGRFVLEARIAGGLDHPGVLPVHELGWRPDGRPYYTMPLLPRGRTLRDQLRQLAGRPYAERRHLLEPFLKVCDTMAYAHGRGVFHRDLKPDNVALGEFGEVLVLDWGIAALSDASESLDDLWRARLQQFRAQHALETVGAAPGTVGYAAPELATSATLRGDARSEVFSLGVILYEILTGERPMEAGQAATLAALVSPAWPPDPGARDATIPPRLAALCRKALDRSPDLRQQAPAALARELRAWEAEHAAQQVEEAHRRTAQLALLEAEASTGAARHRRASDALRSIDLLPEGHPEKDVLRARARAFEAQGVQEEAQLAWERRVRRVTRWVGAAGLLLVAGLVGSVLWGAARARERDEKATLIAKLDQLSDAHLVARLLKESEELWPGVRDVAPRFEAWIRSATDVLGRRGVHQAALVEVRRRGERREVPRLGHQDEVRRRRAMQADLDDLVHALEGVDPATPFGLALVSRRDLVRQQLARAAVPPGEAYAFDAPEDAWRHGVLEQILEGLETLEPAGDPALGLLERVRARFATVRAAAEGDPGLAAAWQGARTRVAHGMRYGGMSLETDAMLVPLGPDPGTGLEEFAVRGTGALPSRDLGTGRLVRSADFGVVLVLLPGGAFPRGADRDGTGDDADPEAQADESPRREIRVGTFYLSKYELTQAQWFRMTEGENPSHEKRGVRVEGDDQPVEMVTWNEAARWLARWGLRLPTEAEWEYACRAGTRTPYHVPPGDRLDRHANLRDRTLELQGPPDWVYAEQYEDGHHFHAPVGTYLPNAFGLYDMHGNVEEWCQDLMDPVYYAYSRDVDPPGSTAEYDPPERIYRGGSWASLPPALRASDRRGQHPGIPERTIGLRPAR